MKRWKSILKAVGVAAAVGAGEAFVRGSNVSTSSDLGKTLAIGAVGGVLFWMQSPNNKPARPSPQDPPKH